MLTTGVICIAPGLTPVKFGDERRQADHGAAEQEAADGVGEVVGNVTPTPSMRSGTTTTAVATAHRAAQVAMMRRPTTITVVVTWPLG
jgi:hypothetical protein